MVTTTFIYDADMSARKRSISENDSPTFNLCPTPKKVEFYVPAVPVNGITQPRTPRRTYESSHRRKSSIEKNVKRLPTRSINMQASNPSAYTLPMPTFTSVFDQSSSPHGLSISNNTSASDLSKDSHGPDTIFSPIEPSFNPFRQERHSTATSISESTDSSPTTTISLDSSSMTEPSPGVSPQSPTALSFAMNESRFTPIERSKPALPTLPVLDLNRPITPAKKPRNLKNLAVNTSAAYNLGRAQSIATAPLKPLDIQSRVSAPASPAFVKPPTPPKRKLGKISLTIMTPANSALNNGAPQTPSITRPMTLRHFQSSPSLPLFTAGAGPMGGMTLPQAKPALVPRGFAEIPVEEEEEDEPNFDIPQSREDKPESYPNGPIRIYESGVDLFYEPSCEIASRYDVIFNVASEVKNPYDVAEALAKETANGAVIDASQNTASPTTPKATPVIAEPVPKTFTAATATRPEYIHIPWEHNTDIVPELHELVKVIDDRVKAGKKVLVHCQCGVSRSASLIVAYGMYTNPGLSVQEAYDAVKKRSKWIGPNMSLIMQLQEFRSGLMRNSRKDHGFQDQIFALPRKSSTIASSTTTDSFDLKTPSEPSTPRTAPFGQDQDGNIQRLNSSDLGPFSAGPVEPGQGSFWDSGFRRSWNSRATSNDLGVTGLAYINDTNYVDTKGHVVPVVTVVENEPTESARKRQSLAKPTLKAPVFTKPLPFRRDYDPDTTMTDAPPLEPLMSPRSTEFHMTPLTPPSHADSHDTFNILSPTATEFPKEAMTFPPPAQLSVPPPVPTRIAPVPPRRISEVPMDSLNSIFSPTSESFPSFQSNSFFPPTDNSLATHPRQTDRIDSLIPPTSPPFVLQESPKPNRKLRSKFSAPNLSDCRKLQAIQTDIANRLPPKAAEAEEALLSPRAENFTANPFHRLPGVISEEPSATSEPREQIIYGESSPSSPDLASTPTSNASDPRSPPQFGISPITRNIWGVI